MGNPKENQKKPHVETYDSGFHEALCVARPEKGKPAINLFDGQKVVPLPILGHSFVASAD